MVIALATSGLYTLVQTERSEQQWIAMMFCTNIHISNMVFAKGFDNPLTFPGIGFYDLINLCDLLTHRALSTTVDIILLYQSFFIIRLLF